MLDYEKIGSFLLNERKKAKLTQKQLGEQLNITFQAVSRWEQGISAPSLDILNELSQIFNVTMDEILQGRRTTTRFSYESSGADAVKMDILNRNSEKYVEINEYNPSFRGGIYDLKNHMPLNHPFIVSRSLEPGAKQKIAIEYGYWKELIQDILFTLINDILTTGAKPLFIANTVLSAQENIRFLNEIETTLYNEAKPFNIKIFKSQYSIKPKIIYPGECLVDSVMTGMVDYDFIINAKHISEGDSILYIESNGLHHHGFSLIDTLLDEVPEIRKETINGINFMDEIMKPPHCYYDCLAPLLTQKKLNGLVNITGFGIPRGLERIIPDNLSLLIDLSKISIPAVYKCLKQYVNMNDSQMINTFNCGVGYILFVSPDYEHTVRKHITSRFLCDKIGIVEKGKERIKFINSLMW